MRILFVAPYLPTPGSGGRTRLVNILARTADRHDVQVVCFRERDQLEETLPFPGVALDPPSLRKRPGGLAGKFRFYAERLEPEPSFAAHLFAPEMVRAIRERIEEFEPDLVQIETTEMGQYLRAIGYGPVRALDLQDVASGWFERVAAHAETRKQRATLRYELRRARRYDRRIARAAEIVFVPSAPEGDRVRALAGIEPIEVPNGVDTTLFDDRPVVAAADASPILFVGPLTYAANLDAVTWFGSEILPRIRVARPDATLDVVGTTVDVPMPDGVRLLGRVPDVRPYVAAARVCVVPIRIGSGTRYKILEAFSMRRAVVSTTIGSEGLGTRDGEHLLLADDADAFAQAVVRALGDAVLCDRLGVAGRALVEASYDWGPVVERMEQAWSASLADVR